MKRVLHIVDSLDMGGIQTFLLNIYRHIDREEVQFDFLVFRMHEQVLEKEVLALGANIYKIPNWRQGVIAYRKNLRVFFNEHTEYEIVHYHAGSLTDIQPLIEAKKAGIRTRIMHSHNTRVAGHLITQYIYRFVHNKNMRRIDKYATHFFACGKLAGEFMFGKIASSNTIHVINNGVNISDYKYDEVLRGKKRKELRLDDKYVIGHVARFSPEKNQTFMIDVIKELSKKIDAILIFVGDGPEKSSVQEKVKQNGLDNRVFFLGIRKDVKELLQAFDAFALPSIMEGFPVTLVEAQAAGLPCIISSSISDEVAIKDNVCQVELDSPINAWVEAFVNNTNRIIQNESLIKAGFDIHYTANQLRRFYEDGIIDEDIKKEI